MCTQVWGIFLRVCQVCREVWVISLRVRQVCREVCHVPTRMYQVSRKGVSGVYTSVGDIFEGVSSM